MSRPLLSRRALLRGLGATAALLPILEADRLSADPVPPIRRLVLMVSPNGVLSDAFWPANKADTPLSAMAIPENLKPLAAGYQVTNDPAKDALPDPMKGLPANTFVDLLGDTTVIGGMTIASEGRPGHDTLPFLLTGASATYGVPNSGGTPILGSGGASIDQYLGDALSSPTQFRTLTLGVQATNPGYQGRASWRGAMMPVEPMNDPYDVFAQMYGPCAGTSGPNGRRKNVLDKVVLADLNRFRQRLGVADRVTLDAHLQAVSDFERQLEPNPKLCGGPSAPLPLDGMGQNYDPLSPANFAVVGKMQMDLVALALASDSARIATILWSDAAGNNVSFPWIGQDWAPLGQDWGTGDGRSHHSMAHVAGITLAQAQGNQNAPDAVANYMRKRAVDSWYVQQFAYLASKLKSTPDPSTGGTLLDSTAVVWMSNMSNGAAHAVAPMPCLIAGSLGGAFKPGCYLNLVGANLGNAENGEWLSHNHLLVSLCQAMGADPQPFQDLHNPGAVLRLTGS